MEGDLPPPSGDDERLSRSGQSSSRLRHSGRAVLTAVSQQPPDGPAVLAPLDETRSALRRYREIVGQPTAIPDLSVDGLMARILPRSSWGTTIRIFLFDTVLLPSVRDEVETKLVGRDPLVAQDEGLLMVTFQLEDGSRESRKRAVDFGRTLALLFDGVHDVHVGNLDEEPRRTQR